MYKLILFQTIYIFRTVHFCILNVRICQINEFQASNYYNKLSSRLDYKKNLNSKKSVVVFTLISNHSKNHSFLKHCLNMLKQYKLFKFQLFFHARTIFIQYTIYKYNLYTNSCDK